MAGQQYLPTMHDLEVAHSLQPDRAEGDVDWQDIFRRLRAKGISDAELHRLTSPQLLRLLLRLERG